MSRFVEKYFEGLPKFTIIVESIVPTPPHFRHEDILETDSVELLEAVKKAILETVEKHGKILVDIPEKV